MRRKHRNYLLLSFALIMLLIVGGVSFVLWQNQGDSDISVPPQQGGINNPPGQTMNPQENDPIRAQLQGMSLEEKVGQLVMAGIDKYTNDANAQQLIQKYRVGGFVILKQNVQNTQQLLSLLNSLKQTNSVNKIPLFLSIDEEGGRISRLPAEFTKIPTNQKIGTVNNGELSYQVGSIIGEEIKAFGLNMNFAPVLDVNSNPQNEVIGDRSFGSAPSLVSKLGVQTMKGIQDQNIISVVKHFPGHGDTHVDSHVGLPMVNHDLNRLKSLELVPFAAAIAEKVDAVMMAHILLPKLDPEYPASFSPAIITEILRKDMKFNGVVITDDMTMGAIIENYDIGEAAVKSLKAGSDIVLVCHDFAKEEAVLKAILKAAETGDLPLERIDESVYRILKLKEKYSVSDLTRNSVNVQNINQKIESMYKKYPSLK